jgi:hypothetical protein
VTKANEKDGGVLLGFGAVYTHNVNLQAWNHFSFGDVDSMFLWNVGIYLRVAYTRRHNPAEPQHPHRSENIER